MPFLTQQIQEICGNMSIHSSTHLFADSCVILNAITNNFFPIRAHTYIQNLYTALGEKVPNELGENWWGSRQLRMLT